MARTLGFAKFLKNQASLPVFLQPSDGTECPNAPQGGVGFIFHPVLLKSIHYLSLPYKSHHLPPGIFICFSVPKGKILIERLTDCLHEIMPILELLLQKTCDHRQGEVGLCQVGKRVPIRPLDVFSDHPAQQFPPAWDV